MRILAIILFFLWALVSANGDENLTLDTKTGKVKKTSSNTGAPAKPINFSDVTVTGISGGGGGTPIPGPTGPPGPPGADGATGAAGPGVATGGTANQVLSKIDSTNYNTQWVTLPGGGNVSNSGTPALDQLPVWTDATHIKGVTGLKGGAANSILSKSSTTDYDWAWTANNALQWDGGATNLVAATGRTSLGLVIGTNVAPATSGSSILKGNGSGGFSNAAAGTDYAAATSGSSILYGNGSGGFSNVTVGSGLSFTTGTLTATGTPTAPLTLTASDGVTTGVTDILTLAHNSTGAATTSFGTGLMLLAEDSTTNDVNVGEIQGIWTNPTHLSNSSDLLFRVTDTSATLVTRATLKSTGIFNAFLGFTVAGAAGSGRMLQGDGAKYTVSGLVWPTAVGTTGKVLQADGTNYTASTPTWPTTAGTAGYSMRSDGTNIASYPQDMLNSSVTTQGSIGTADSYLTNSNVTVAAGDMKAKGQYRCLFDMTKSAGTGAIVITVRVGPAGGIGDPAILTFTFGAGTSIADTGIFEIIATWRTVGSGTSAVMQGVCRAQKNAATTTGLWNNAGTDLVIVAATSSGFNSSTATSIGVSFNGSTAFAGTSTLVQASLLQ